MNEVISQEVACPIKIRWLRAKRKRIELVTIIGLKVPDSPGAFSPMGIGNIPIHDPAGPRIVAYLTEGCT